MTLHVSDGVAVTVNDQTVREYVMKFEDDKTPDQSKVGSLNLGVIKRGERYGLRVRDKNSPARLGFKGLRWFPAQEKFKVVATFTPFAEPKEIIIMNVLGDELKLKTPDCSHSNSMANSLNFVRSLRMRRSFSSSFVI